MPLKSQVAPPGIDPGTVRLVAQRLNHYAAPDPSKFKVVSKIACGFGGLEVSVLASGTQVRWFKPGRSRRIFRAKKSSARLPSEGK